MWQQLVWNTWKHESVYASFGWFECTQLWISAHNVNELQQSSMSDSSNWQKKLWPSKLLTLISHQNHPVDCGPLTNPDNGQVDTPQGTTFNQVATYSCNNGYLLVGNMTRVCQVDGRWSGTDPFCRNRKFYNCLTYKSVYCNNRLCVFSLVALCTVRS